MTHLTATPIRRFFTFALFALLLAGAPAGLERTAAQADPNQRVAPAAFQDLCWRNVGPTRGGRVTASPASASSPASSTWARPAAASGRRTNCGADWRRSRDGQIATGSIGSIDVSPVEPERRLGRDRQRRHPQQRHHRPRRLQVGRRRPDMAVHGPEGRWTDWCRRASIRPTPTSSGSRRSVRRSGPNDERGIFKTTDGGRTWRKTLFVNDETGGRVLAVNTRTRTSSMPGCIAASAKAGTSSAAAPPPKAASTSRSTAARRGRSSRTACRRS